MNEQMNCYGSLGSVVQTQSLPGLRVERAANGWIVHTTSLTKSVASSFEELVVILRDFYKLDAGK